MPVILFDFDGVIVDTYRFCFRMMQARDHVTEEEYRARFEGNVNQAPRPPADPNAPPFDFYGQYTPQLMLCKPNSELTETIRGLAQDHTLIIISSTNTQPIIDFLELHDMRDAFQEILGNDVEKSKVKKINDVLQRYDLQPTDTVLITDTLGDIKEARTCGVPTLAVTWGYHSAETLAKGNPYRLIDHPHEIIPAIQALKNDPSVVQ